MNNGKQGGVIELCVLALLSKTPISVAQQQLTDQLNPNDATFQLIYTPLTIDEGTQQIIDGHYELAGGSNASSGPNDCIYYAIFKQKTKYIQISC